MGKRLVLRYPAFEETFEISPEEENLFDENGNLREGVDASFELDFYLSEVELPMPTITLEDDE